jgi:hypothetical protein
MKLLMSFDTGGQIIGPGTYMESQHEMGNPNGS